MVNENRCQTTIMHLTMVNENRYQTTIMHLTMVNENRCQTTITLSGGSIMKLIILKHHCLYLWFGASLPLNMGLEAAILNRTIFRENFILITKNI